MPGTIWTKNKEHVPTRHVARAVEDKLRDVSGIAAPGMPRKVLAHLLALVTTDRVETSSNETDPEPTYRLR